MGRGTGTQFARVRGEAVALGMTGAPQRKERDLVEHGIEQRPTTPVTSGSPQLRATIERARIYLEEGNASEAAELCRATIDAGYDGADAAVLLGRALLSQGDATGAATASERAVGDPIWDGPARELLAKIAAGQTGADHPANLRGGPTASDRAAKAPPRIDLGPLAVIRPLPASDELPRAVIRALQECDVDIARGRYESALDLTIYAETLAPDSLPLFVRHAELLVVTGRPQDAVKLAGTIERLTKETDDGRFAVELARIMAHADPQVSRIVPLAQTLLVERRTDLIGAYVPAAITALLRDGNSDAATDLAKRWCETQDGGSEALYAYVRELLRNGRADKAVTLVPDSGNDARSTVAALTAAAVAGSALQWSIAARLTHEIAARRYDRADVQRLLAEMAVVAPDAPTLGVHRALAGLAGADAREALSRLQGYRAAGPIDAFVAAVVASRAAATLGDDAATLDALQRAFELATEPEVISQVQGTALFDPPASLAELGRELAARLGEREDWKAAAKVYAIVLQAQPGDTQIARAHGEALGRAGQRNEALERLTTLLSEQEGAGKLEAALETLRTIVRIAPGNLTHRSQLIDGLMKRGKIQDAVAELFVFAQLLERANRVSDAIAQLRRAAEISSLTGEWGNVDQIYRYMIQMQPEDIGMRHAAAATFLQHGQIRPALEQLREVVRISVVREDPDEAIAALHQIIALAPNDPEPYHRLGELLASVGEYGQAERVYRRLVTLLPEDPAVMAKQKALAALAQGRG